ncbi:MAG: hypothetical protein DRG87_02150 [Deltaproteobacteria bacterium]|nr:MAG: hypothetical protein DRG87_02150 [Deltaproteobacteria bacterium]
MKKALTYKIIGIVIVVVWIFMIAELARRTHFASKDVEFTHEDEKGIPKGDSIQWMDILLKGRKAGYAVTKITRVNGQREVNERVFLIVNLMGSTRKILSTTRAQVDEGFHVTSFTFSLSSGLIDFKVSGRIKGKDLFIWMGQEGQGEVKRIRLPVKPMINAGVTQYFRSRELKVGHTFSFPLFDPVIMTTNPAVIKVVGKEEITLNDTTYDAFRLEMSFLGKTLIFWLDEQGNSLKEEGFMGFTLVRTTPSKALAGLDSSMRVDFYELSAIAVAKELENPREASYLSVRFDQLPSSMPIDGSRQIMEGEIVKVVKEMPPFAASYTIPHRGGNRKLMPYLMPEPLVQSGDEEIISAAEEIVGGTTEPYAAAKLLMEWVFENMEKTPLVSIPDAKQILRDRKGDCNEHAALLTALLRAVGIPARIAVGLVYNDGKFYYHAWNEAYLDRWISMDATLNQVPADATHIKLVDGGLEKQIQIVGMIGNLTVTILDYR